MGYTNTKKKKKKKNTVATSKRPFEVHADVNERKEGIIMINELKIFSGFIYRTVSRFSYNVFDVEVDRKFWYLESKSIVRIRSE